MSKSTLIKLLEVFPFGVPGECLMGFAILAALHNDNFILILIWITHELKLL